MSGKYSAYIILLSVVFLGYSSSIQAQQPTAIIVNSTDDPGTPGDNFVTLREAILFATGKAIASGGEMAFVPVEYGANHADMIQFDSVAYNRNLPCFIGHGR